MSLVQVNWNPDSRSLRQFAAIWFPAFFAVVGFILFKSVATQVGVTVWILAAIASVGGILWPPSIKPIYRILMAVSLPIGLVVSHLLIAGLYYLVVTPIGLMTRTFGRDPMQRKLDSSVDSYWIPRTSSSDLKQYLRQF